MIISDYKYFLLFNKTSGTFPPPPTTVARFLFFTFRFHAANEGRFIYTYIYYKTFICEQKLLKGTIFTNRRGLYTHARTIIQPRINIYIYIRVYIIYKHAHVHYTARVQERRNDISAVFFLFFFFFTCRKMEIFFYNIKILINARARARSLLSAAAVSRFSGPYSRVRPGINI